jgi:CheY-like chemotaxis protein
MGRRVLVVDDDVLVLELIASMLEELGCDVLQARSSVEAFGKIEGDQSIEILIADMNMPGLSGVQLAERASEFRRGLQVILVSGRDGETHGFPLIRKPFLQTDLQRVMAQTTRHR